MSNLTVDTLREHVGPTTVLREYEVFPEIDSTNTYVRERADAPEGLVVVAEYQTAGRGRQGRVWVAPRGTAIHCSVLLRPPLPRAKLFLLTASCAVAVRDVLASVVGSDVELKWPNDVLVGRRKVCGILTEVELRSREHPRVVLGFGVNVHAAPPPEIAPQATCVAEHSHATVTRLKLLAAILRRYDSALARLYGGEYEGAWEEWRQGLSTIGQRVQVRGEHGPIRGLARDVAPDGGLILEAEPDGVSKVVHAGEAIEQASE